MALATEIHSPKPAEIVEDEGNLDSGILNRGILERGTLDREVTKSLGTFESVQ